MEELERIIEDLTKKGEFEKFLYDVNDAPFIFSVKREEGKAVKLEIRGTLRTILFGIVYAVKDLSEKSGIDEDMIYKLLKDGSTLINEINDGGKK